MSEQVYEQLTLFQEDSLANLFPSPGSEEARKTTVSSGLRCAELLKNFGPLGCLARMCLVSSVWHSTKCFLTWRVQGTSANALLYRLVASMPHTEENGSPFWPTVCNQNAKARWSTGQKKALERLVKKGLMTEEEREQTLKGKGNPELMEWLMGYEKTFTELVPTLKYTDYKGAASTRYVGGVAYKHYLSELLECTPLGIIGRMNPEWTEWLMGYPIGWTELGA